MYEVAVGFIKEIGFPVFVAVYLLTVHRKALQENTKAINELTRYVKNHNDGVEGSKVKRRR